MLHRLNDEPPIECTPIMADSIMPCMPICHVAISSQAGHITRPSNRVACECYANKMNWLVNATKRAPARATTGQPPQLISHLPTMKNAKTHRQDRRSYARHIAQSLEWSGACKNRNNPHNECRSMIHHPVLITITPQ